MENIILLYRLDGDLKVEYFKDIAGLETTYNCIKLYFGSRFVLEYVGSIRNKLEFVKETDIWEVVAV